jgi:hypothetical protein
MLGMALGLVPHFMGKTVLSLSITMIAAGLAMLVLGACNTTFTHNGTYAMACALSTMFYSLTCTRWRNAKKENARGARFVWGICVIIMLVMFHNRSNWLPGNLPGGLSFLVARRSQDPTVALLVLYYIGLLPNWANCLVSAYVFNQYYVDATAIGCFVTQDAFINCVSDYTLIMLFMLLSVLHLYQCLRAWKREGFLFP